MTSPFETEWTATCGADFTGTTFNMLRGDGSIASTTLPDGRVQTATAKDLKTQAPTSVTRSDNGQVNHNIDALGRQSNQSGAGVLPAVFTYNDTSGLGQLASLKTFQSGTLNGSGAATTSFAYDPNTGMESSKTYADGSSQSFTDNAKGQLAGTVLPGGTGSTGSPQADTGSLAYDSGGRISESSYSDNAAGQTAADYIDNYDDQNRPTVLVDDTSGGPNGAVSTTTALSYTNQDQLQSDTTGPTGARVVYAYFQPGSNTTNQYAEPGAIATMKIVLGTSTLAEYDYAYDPASKRLLSITLKGANGGADQTFTYGYQTSTNLISSVGSTGANTSFTYEPTTGRLSSINAINTTTDQTVYNAVYGYNQIDQRTNDTISRINADGTTQNYTTAYGYNTTDELTAATNTVITGTAPANFSATYDGVGNRTDLGLGTVNLVNQYGSFTYNSRGDLTNDNVNAYGYDPKDRLNSVTPDNPTASSQKLNFQYDAEGRRTEKDVFAWFGNAWVFSYARRWAYNGSNAVAEFDGSNNLLKTFVWGQNNQLLAVTDYTSGSPKVYNTILDAQGNVVALTDATGAVVASYTYDPYGKLLSAVGPGANICPFLYGGGYRDSESGLILLGARYYSPALGRFLTRDPSGESGGLNLYPYANGNPISNIDPSGLEPIPDKLDWPAEQLTLDELKANSAYDNNNYLRTSSPDIFRSASDGLYYRISGETKGEETVTVVHSTGLAFIRDWILNGFSSTEKHETVTFDYQEVPPPNFPTADALYSWFRAQDELISSVVSGADLTLSTVEAATYLTPIGWFAAASNAVTGEDFFRAGSTLDWKQRAGNGIVAALPLLSLLRDADAVGQGGRIVYGSLDELGRPSGVYAEITEDMIGTGTRASESIRPPGFLGGGPGSVGHARRHLLGKQLGGPGDEPLNLVTLFQSPANHPVMSGFEAQVRSVVEAGETVKYWAVPVYDGPALVPAGIDLSAIGSKGFTLRAYVPNK